MKKFAYLLIYIGFITLSIISCKKKEISEGLPNDLIKAKLDSTLITNENTLLPAGVDAANSLPILFDGIHEKRIIIKSDAMVYVTFLSEGAGYTNSLGYYTYPLSEAPSKTNMTILFPNISEVGSGGALTPGDIVQVGTGIIPKGTVLGFYLIANGWQDSQITDGLYTLFTDTIFNPNHTQQSILNIEKTTGKLVLGFEDTLKGSVGNDMDCNDILISISDSKNPAVVPTAFDISNVPAL